MKKLKNKADVLKPEAEDLKSRKFTIKVANTLKIEMAEQSSKLQHTTASHHVMLELFMSVQSSCYSTWSNRKETTSMIVCQDMHQKTVKKLLLSDWPSGKKIWQ